MTGNFQKQWKILEKMAELGKIPHALLFYGPSQEKKTLALEFIKLVNGQNALEGVHPDLVIVEPQENGEIEISQIRELHSKLSLKSYSASFKAIIIERAHCLNQDAQSAFLKLLEEPKGKTIFILLTEYPEMLLPTILSRVERLRFYSDRKEDYPEEEIKKISEISRSGLVRRFQYAKELSEDPQNLKKNLETWLGYFRQKLLESIDNPSPQYDLSKLSKILRSLQTTHFLISTTNVSARLALEIFMLEL